MAERVCCHFQTALKINIFSLNLQQIHTSTPCQPVLLELSAIVVSCSCMQ
ncbi:hypothetical protein GBAR_LOCUS23773 [Geodia barretti]|uniref:Uncharacterized protein n=1 Tax=Geodia barretti TaxID=519541 RepID=A0AA35T7T5_GEOBA|nr:hypothetical protein GBAR_LOCUS23773 [Geodia barretti]